MSSRLISFFFFYMLPRPPTSTLFPYTTLFRSQRITTPFHIYKSVIIPNGLYHFARHQLTYGSRQDRSFTYNFFERFGGYRSEEHTSELQSQFHLVCRLLLEKKKKKHTNIVNTT